MAFLFLSLRAYRVTMLKDGCEIRIYSFGNASSPKRPTHVTTLHLPLPHNHCVLLELTATTGPFLARPPACLLNAGITVPFLSLLASHVSLMTIVITRPNGIVVNSFCLHE
jgi:hypothetical protein